MLSAFANRICLFHYGGHADGGELHFENSPGHVQGLAQLLGQLQPGLQLAFLNGCSTQEQAGVYLEAGVPVVLATTRAVIDSDATDFAA